MKILCLNLVFLLTISAIAQPINYQGRLSEKSGTNVNGTRNFTLRIFDAKTGGKQIYEENVGAVAVNEGAYSFNFGESGKSVSTATESIGFADGEKQIFNYIVKNTPVLGEIKISGGGYSWTESGSSDATKFTATANKNSGAMSAIYLTGAPEAGQQIAISYDHNSDGVMGALSRGGQAWFQLIVGGEALSPRERLVAVPFALKALESESSKKHPESLIFRSPGYISEIKGISWSGEKALYKWNKNYEINVFIPTGAKYITYKQDDFHYRFKGSGYGQDPYEVKWRLRIDESVSNIISVNGKYNQRIKLQDPIFRLDVQETGYKKVYLEFYESDNSTPGRYPNTQSEIESFKNIFIHAHFD
jgi:hypothetical protein